MPSDLRSARSGGIRASRDRGTAALLHRELKITAPQSEDEDARTFVSAEENPVMIQRAATAR